GLNWLEKLAPDFGLQIVSSEAFGVSDTDMTPQLVKIKDSGAQAIICWTIGPAGARAAKNGKQPPFV
ncbi:MAG TPA: ABC transporter substrate-binding protein, partial [Syntrophobacteraceae bacterium]|nr:ABC transporter substrate-binding protein [Syntrophobacteraceae bacterium]